VEEVIEWVRKGGNMTKVVKRGMPVVGSGLTPRTIAKRKARLAAMWPRNSDKNVDVEADFRAMCAAFIKKHKLGAAKAIGRSRGKCRNPKCGSRTLIRWPEPFGGIHLLCTRCGWSDRVLPEEMKEKV
jgi:hypothetical protein